MANHLGNKGITVQLWAREEEVELLKRRIVHFPKKQGPNVATKKKETVNLAGGSKHQWEAWEQHLFGRQELAFNSILCLYIHQTEMS